MAHDVFISYSSHDKTTADAVCAVMEQRRIRCWMAPRDILPGEDWATSIIQAINTAKVFLLIFSEASNSSGQVKREVERAANRNLPIIPFRINDIAPNESLEFFISTPHWLDAFTPPLQAHAERLSDTVERLIGPAANRRPTPVPPTAVEPEPVADPPPPPLPKAKTPKAPEPLDDAPAEPVEGLAAALHNHGPFFLLAATIVGACLFAASRIFLRNGNPAADLDSFYFTPVFALPVAAVLWGWGRLGLLPALVWILGMTGAHFGATEATLISMGLVSKSPAVSAAFGFAIGGAVGGGVSLFALTLLGRRLLHGVNFALAAAGTVALAVVAGLPILLLGGKGDHLDLTLFIPWQLVFGFSILAVVEGRLVPPATANGFVPKTQLGGAIFAVLASAALAAFVLANPALLRKPDPSLLHLTPTPPADSAPAAPEPAPAAAPPEALTATPVSPKAIQVAPPSTPAPTPAPPKPAPKPVAKFTPDDDDPIGAGGFITPPTTPAPSGESFSPAGR